ncbi:hypothetical protein [Streptomyces scabiei]|nr:hypothetical protein [Streptomyces scabiei]MDX3524532.1 hypothetical protein [Streptomyces scabiei]
MGDEEPDCPRRAARTTSLPETAHHTPGTELGRAMLLHARLTSE